MLIQAISHKILKSHAANNKSNSFLITYKSCITWLLHIHSQHLLPFNSLFTVQPSVVTVKKNLGSLNVLVHLTWDFYILGLFACRRVSFYPHLLKTCYATKAGLKILILLTLPPKFLDYRCEPLCQLNQYI